MLKTIKAKYSNGVIEPLEKLNLEEGAEILVQIQQEPKPTNAGESIIRIFEKARESVPESAFDDLPTDGAKNYKHYLYGFPKEK